jgi:hypothetical protein
MQETEKSIHLQIGNDLSGVVNFGTIEGNVAGNTNRSGPGASNSDQHSQNPSGYGAPSGQLPRSGPWRVFLSHTSELRDYPQFNSYIDCAERAVSAAGHAVRDMADFPAADQAPASVCEQRVNESDVYMGIYGMRYGSPVRDQPDISYTELEFNASSARGMPRLIFVIDSESADLALPPKALIDREYGHRQDAFLRRVKEAGLTLQRFRSPDDLKLLIERSLRALADRKDLTC